MNKFTTPDLPYAYDALEPYMDKATMEIHHDKHHAGYTTKLNNALENNTEYFDKTPEEILQNIDQVPEDIRTAVKNNAGGHVHHDIWWQTMRAGQENNKPTSEILSEIEKTCTHVGIINQGKIIFQDTVKALKTSKEGKINVEMEVNDIETSQKIVLEKIGLKTTVEENLLLLDVDVKEDISLIIDILRSSEISVYQIRIKDNLEDLFLALTEIN